MIAGDVFTYSEFETNAFQYTNDGVSAVYDTFQLSVSDGEHESYASVNVTIIAVDKSAPYMLTSASCRLVVVEGELVKLSYTHTICPILMSPIYVTRYHHHHHHIRFRARFPLPRVGLFDKSSS